MPSTGLVKAGHYHTIIGYERVPPINNFFYAKSFAYQFALPDGSTHWDAADG